MSVSDTSAAVYHGEIKGAKEGRENARVLACIKRLGKATGRMISRETGIENSAVARSLNNLWSKDRTITVFKKDACPVTGRKVKWYTAEFHNCEDGQYVIS
jgi:DNA-binding MarR family transcriptional regulator